MDLKQTPLNQSELRKELLQQSLTCSQFCKTNATEACKAYGDAFEVEAAEEDDSGEAEATEEKLLSLRAKKRLEMQEFFKKHVYRHHGLPQKTDRDSLFVSKFWKTLLRLLSQRPHCLQPTIPRRMDKRRFPTALYKNLLELSPNSEKKIVRNDWWISKWHAILLSIAQHHFPPFLNYDLKPRGIPL